MVEQTVAGLGSLCEAHKRVVHEDVRMKPKLTIPENIVEPLMDEELS